MSARIEKEVQRYVPYSHDDGDISFGMPIELDGQQWFIDRRIYLIRPDRPVGVIFTLGDPGNRMTLLQNQYERALRLRSVHDDIAEPVYRYISLSAVPKGMFNWSESSIEVLTVSDSQSIQGADTSLHTIFSRADAQAPVYSVEENWRRKGADLHFKPKKNLKPTRIR